MEVILVIIGIIIGVVIIALNIILFCKIWGMCNDVDRLTNYIISERETEKKRLKAAEKSTNSESADTPKSESTSADTTTADETSATPQGNQSNNIMAEVFTIIMIFIILVAIIMVINK